MTKRNTGLGVEAFFPLEENKVSTREGKLPSPIKPHPKKGIRSKPRTRIGISTPSEKIEGGKETMIERRPAWIRSDHLERLDALKHRERKRLHLEAKRASRSTLIDEAIERYLLEMEE